MTLTPANGSIAELSHDPESGTYRATPAEGANLSTAVVTAVATIEGRDAAAISPLHEAVDPGALEALFAHLDARTPRSEGEVTFPFGGYSVTVRANREILLCAHDSTEATAAPGGAGVT